MNFMSKKVLITGGAGFIGSAVVNNLQKAGHEVWVVDDLSFGSLDFVTLDKDHFIREDILNRKTISDLMIRIQPQWVIHLAAIHFIPYCNQHPFESSNINLQGTLNVLDAATQTDSVEKVFFASTAAVYPNLDGPIPETTHPGPMDIYGLSKLMGEQLCKKFSLERNIPVIICRFFNAFGPNETNPHLIPEIQKQIKSGNRRIKLGNLDPKRDFIHTYDMARAVSMLLNSEINGVEVFNLGRGIEYSVREIVESFERVLEEGIEIIVDPERVRKVERMHLLADISKLSRFTGWQPEWQIDQGVKDLLS